MTITDFTSLTLPDQLEYLYAEGVYLCKRKTADRTVLLYQLNQLYIELFYSRYRYIVREVHCSGSVDILHPYLENLSINGLFDDP